MLMGTKPSLFEKKSKPKPVKEISIRVSDNGGYVVSHNKSGADFERVEKTYNTLDEVMKCIEDTFPKQKKDPAGGYAE